jgi:hypothetical protein
MSRILTSLHGREVGLNQNRRLQCGKGFVAGEHGKQFALPSPDRVTFLEHFLGDVISDQCNFLEGSDSATSTAAILAGGIGGVVRFTTGDVTGVTAANVLANAESLVHELQWQASNGGLAMQVRFKLTTITTGFAFIGFTDYTTAELPIEGSGSANGLTTNASDAVGFLYDVRMTSAGWWLTGVAANTDATAQASGVAPVADTYQTLRVEVTTSGVATFFINGVQVGTSMTGAITAATDLTPVVCVSKAAADTTSITADLDYLHVVMDCGADNATV